MADLEERERAVKKLEKCSEANLTRKSLASIEWSYNKAAAIRFSRHVQSCHVTLSLALITLQM
jgi:hypothetical protein